MKYFLQDIMDGANLCQREPQREYGYEISILSHYQNNKGMCHYINKGSIHLRPHAPGAPPEQSLAHLPHTFQARPGRIG